MNTKEKSQGVLETAGASIPVSIPFPLAESGVTGHHENEQMTDISTSHDGLLEPAKADVPVHTEHLGLVTLPEKPTGAPMRDPSWGAFHMRKKREEMAGKNPAKEGQ